MDWHGRLRMVFTPAVGAVIVAGSVGAALLAGSLAGAQAGSTESYYNGGFCYRNPDGQENPYRLQVTEIRYDVNQAIAVFSLQPQKWDGTSSQYRDDAPAFELPGLRKSRLQDMDANEFCKDLTEGKPELRGEVYSYGAWASRRAPDSPTLPPPTTPVVPDVAG